MKTSLMKILLATFICASCTATVQKKEDDTHGFTYYSYEGTIGSNIPASLRFVVRDDDLAAGEILYTAKSTTPISVYGQVLRFDDGTSSVSLAEYLPDGSLCGNISAEWRGGGKLEGKWFTTSRSLRLEMRDAARNDAGGTSGAGSYLSGENPLRSVGEEEIGEYSAYSYSFKDPRHGLLGGRAEFFTPRNGPLSFSIDCSTPNLASVSNGEDTVQTFLDGNRFQYRMCTCGYSMEVEFFPGAVHVRGLAYDPECFGRNATPDGWYILQAKSLNE